MVFGSGGKSAGAGALYGRPSFDHAIRGLDQPQVEARFGPPSAQSEHGIGKALEHPPAELLDRVDLLPRS
jgi:hypothetical protein